MMIAMMIALASAFSMACPPPGPACDGDDRLTVEQQVKTYELARQVCPKQDSYEAAKAKLRLPEQLLLSSMCQMYLRGALDLIDKLEPGK
jgi:hypothetical protein